MPTTYYNGEFDRSQLLRSPLLDDLVEDRLRSVERLSLGARLRVTVHRDRLPPVDEHAGWHIMRTGILPRRAESADADSLELKRERTHP